MALTKISSIFSSRSEDCSFFSSCTEFFSMITSPSFLGARGLKGLPAFLISFGNVAKKVLTVVNTLGAYGYHFEKYHPN